MNTPLIPLLLALWTASTLAKAQAPAAAADPPLVFTLKLNADIDPRTNRYTKLALAQAQALDADYVVIEMDTYGGALNDADDIRTRLLDFDRPVYVFINKDAASAGALIAIACDSIYMAKGASIGAATVVTQDGSAAPDKYQSYMRSIMRATAEAKGRNPKIAEAMVDQDLQIDSIATQGKVITFSTSEAIQHGFCEAEVSGLKQIMKRSGIDQYTHTAFELSTTEKIIRIFINPFVSGFLILIILGGIYFELQTPGIGFPILASLTALILYFIPYYLNGLATHWEIALFITGIILLLLEILVIPGFGLAGISGIIFATASLILVMLNNDWLDFSFVPTGDIFAAILTTFLGLSGALIIMFIGGIRLVDTRIFKKIALVYTLDKSQGYTSNFKSSSHLGQQGTAHTVLRPSGKIKIGEELYDAYTRGEYLAQGTPIEVISEEGTSLKVKAQA